MSRRFFGLPIALFGALCAADAQPLDFQAPTAGYVYSRRSLTIRPVYGIPGSSYLGLPVTEKIAAASISPGGEWAFVSNDGHSRILRGFTDVAPEIAPEGLLDAVDRVAWNRAGTLAVLYSSSNARFQRVRFSQNKVAADAPLALPTDGQVTTIAIDPAGRQVAIGIAGSGIYLFNADQPPALLAGMAQPAAATFDSSGRLFVVNLEMQQIVEFQSGSGPMEFAPLAGPDSPALNPLGMAVSGNGRYLLLADSITSTVRVYDLESRTLINTVPLQFTPSRLELLSSAPVFVLAGENDQLLLLDAREDLQVYFVPAGQEPAL